MSRTVAVDRVIFAFDRAHLYSTRRTVYLSDPSSYIEKRFRNPSSGHYETVSRRNRAGWTTFSHPGFVGSVPLRSLPVAETGELNGSVIANVRTTNSRRRPFFGIAASNSASMPSEWGNGFVIVQQPSMANVVVKRIRFRRTPVVTNVSTPGYIHQRRCLSYVVRMALREHRRRLTSCLEMSLGPTCSL